jgi:uncharacterized protein YdeI (YjbR/CyaY-like superfamily)
METVFAKKRAEWRRWLEKNHVHSQGIWLGFYKKVTGKPTLAYDAAVEEALCFGWIDGTKKKLDEECYVFRFTPRKPNSLWSKSNLQRAERMIAEGKMMAAGLKAYNKSDRREVMPMPSELPKNLEERFRKQPTAWANYQKFPAGYRRMTAGWVASAKKQETQIKRLENLMEFSSRNERIRFM